MPRLENWSMTHRTDNPFQAPEQGTFRLQGDVYGHSRFEDGDPVTTSSIVELDVKGRKARTRNTTYDLGEPAKEYLDWLAAQGKTLEGKGE